MKVGKNFGLVTMIASAMILCSCEDEGETYDLPTGWEDAHLITDFSTESKKPANYEDDEGGREIVITAGASLVKVDLLNALFNCSHPVHGFRKIDTSSVDMLIQPIDMDPEMEGGDCRYDMAFRIDGVPSGDNIEVNVYYRGHNLSRHREPSLWETATITVGE